ncbi:type II toxin-antitoxin system RelB/DinJ family antitoxin [bacterium]|nr:type II toxin-antitoxin system RelB/DinJ family antitoxin [bacterium]
MTATTNKVRTNVYLDATTKEKAQEIFKQYGLGLSEAFNIFLTPSVLERGIPFEIKIPNDETLEAIKDARVNKNMTKVNLEELPQEARDHFLTGDWKDTKEFHISGDLLVIYMINDNTLQLLRIGTHSQLFK